MSAPRIFPGATDSNHPASEGGVQVVSIRDCASEAILESRFRDRTEDHAQNQGGVVIG
jgi:hypothetical protein